MADKDQNEKKEEKKPDQKTKTDVHGSRRPAEKRQEEEPRKE